MQKFFAILILVFVMETPPTTAQETNKVNYKQVDSLLSLLPKIGMCQKVLVMHEIGRIYEAKHSDSSIYFAKKALELAEKHNYDSGIVLANHQIGDFYQSKRNYLKAFVHYKEAYDYVGQLVILPDEAVLTTKLGFNYFMRGDYANALALYDKALIINKKENNEKEIAGILKNIGIAHSEQGNQEKAQIYLLESIKTFEEIADEKGKASSMNNLAMVLIHAKEYAKALVYVEKTLKIRAKYQDVSGIANCYTIFGKVYQAQKKFEKAIYYFHLALELRLKIKDKYNIAYLDNYLSDIYLQKKQHHISIDYAQKSVRAFTESGVKIGITHGYELLCKNYEAMKNHEQALHYHKLVATFKDSILNEEKAKTVANLEAKFEIELKEREILEHKQQNELLKKEKELKEAKIEEQYAIGIAVFGALFTAIFLAGLFYRIHLKDKKINLELTLLNQTITAQKEQIQAQAHQLQDANRLISATNVDLTATVQQRTTQLQNVNEELDTFMYHTSHDLRQPLVNFIGLAEVAKISVKDKEALYLFGLVRQITDKMDRMLHKMQIISNIYAINTPLGTVNLDKVLEEVNLRFTKELEKIDYQVINLLTQPILSNHYLLYVIIKNIVENALHFQKQNLPYIHIETKIIDNQLIMAIRDNGEGIPDLLHAKIFEMYFRGSENSKGNGLGLYIVKKAVERLAGQIEVYSEVNRGTTFIIKIPATEA
jgi:signal transduction histidine kinase